MKRLFAWLFGSVPIAKPAPAPRPLSFVEKHFEAQDRGDFSPWTRRP